MQGELCNTENRCQLLEKQLDYMRRIVKMAETDTLQRVNDIEEHKGNATTRELQGQIDKIAELERDHLRMTAMQTLAQVSLSNPPLIHTKFSHISDLVIYITFYYTDNCDAFYKIHGFKNQAFYKLPKSFRHLIKCPSK